MAMSIITPRRCGTLTWEHISVCPENPLLAEDVIAGMELSTLDDAVAFLRKAYGESKSLALVRWNDVVMDIDGQEATVPTMPDDAGSRAFAALSTEEQEEIIGVCTAEQTLSDDKFATKKSDAGGVLIERFLDKASANVLGSACRAMKVLMPSLVDEKSANEILERCEYTVAHSAIDKPLPDKNVDPRDILAVVTTGIALHGADDADALVKKSHLSWCRYEELTATRDLALSQGVPDAAAVINAGLRGRWPDDALVLWYRRAIHRPDRQMLIKGSKASWSMDCPVVFVWPDDGQPSGCSASLFHKGGSPYPDKRNPPPVEIEGSDRLMAAATPRVTGESHAGNRYGSPHELRAQGRLRVRQFDRRRGPITGRLRQLSKMVQAVVGGAHRASIEHRAPMGFGQIIADRMEIECESLRLRLWGLNREREQVQQKPSGIER